MRVLLDSGTDAALPLKNAWTPVSLAAGAGWRYGTRDRRDSALIRLPAAQRELYDESRTLEAVKIAVEAGTDVNVLDEDGDTALHYVVDKGVLSVVAFLTESGADVNATNRHGQAPLTRSARRHPEVSAEVTQAIGDLLRTLTEITLLCAERPKPQKTGSAWMHLATLYRSRSLTGWARAEHALNKGDLPAARGLRHGLLRSWEKQRWCSRLDNAIVAAGSSSSSLPARPSRLPLAGRARAYSEGAITSFDHVAVPMQNTEAMIAFYRALGLHVMETAGRVSVHFGDQKINFHRPSSWQRASSTSLRAPAARPPCGDFCFVWSGSEDSLTTVLDRAGAEVIGSGLRDGGRALGTVRGMSRYVRDPDGNLLEFMIYS